MCIKNFNSSLIGLPNIMCGFSSLKIRSILIFMKCGGKKLQHISIWFNNSSIQYRKCEETICVLQQQIKTFLSSYIKSTIKCSVSCCVCICVPRQVVLNLNSSAPVNNYTDISFHTKFPFLLFASRTHKKPSK